MDHGHLVKEEPQAAAELGEPMEHSYGKSMVRKERNVVHMEKSLNYTKLVT